MIGEQITQPAMDSKAFTPHNEEFYELGHLGDNNNRRGPLVLGLAIAVLTVFGALVWNVYHQGINPEDKELPVIAASTPIKRIPDTVTSKSVSKPKSGIYNQLDGTKDSVSVTLIPVREAPVEFPKEPDMVTTGDSINLRPLTSTKHSVIGTRETRTSKSDISEYSSPADLKHRSRSGSNHEIRSSIPRFIFIPDGQYLVQVSALRTHANAVNAWQRLNFKLPKLMEGAHMDIQKADLGARGIFYRLRVAGFDTKTEADRFCNELKSHEENCISVFKYKA